jgi:hypothetical protein
MYLGIVFFIIYVLFLLWHRRWFSKPLSKEELTAWQENQERGQHSVYSDLERENVRAFLEADDGKPFYMVNLMKYRDKALYPGGEFPEVKTGRQANAHYTKAVVRELIKRGSYPVFLSSKLSNLLTPGGDEDFFEEVGIVRYRSRRDMLQMTNGPDFIKAEPHKWASMEKTVVVPTKKLLMIDLGVLVPLVLFVIWLLVN